MKDQPFMLVNMSYIDPSRVSVCLQLDKESIHWSSTTGQVVQKSCESVDVVDTPVFIGF